MREFISYLEARSIVLEHVPTPDIEKVPLDAALGRTLAQAVESGELIPPFDNSAMDGFVVRSSDVRKPGVELPVVGTIAAGDDAEMPLTSGTCMRIMTGAPIPDGADAVIPVEQADVDGNRVRFRIAAENPGKLIRRAGENVKIGDRVLGPGLRITPPIIGILATLGYASVDVARRPVVGVVATGNELVDASETPGPGQIRDANGPVLAAQVATAGGRVDGPDRVGDNRELLRRTLESKASADLLVVSGGVSMGEFDFVREELEEIGFEPLFWKVRQKPGKPILFGMIEQTPVFGLPGNPVSASVCFEQYVRPAVATMLGRSEISPPLEKAVLDEDVSKRAGLHHFVRGRLRYADVLRVAPTGPQGSHISHSLVIADCLIHLPEDMADPRLGTQVTVERLRW
jgi:molybdopterin molybdotransferase